MQGCAHPLQRSEREIKKERESGERERERVREIEKESEKEGERDVEYVQNRYFYLKKGMTGALALFIYLVFQIHHSVRLRP